MLLHFLTTFFDTFGLIGSVKTFFKSPGRWHECRPIYGLHFVYIGFFYPLYKKGVFGGPKKFHQRFLAFFLAILAFKMAHFLKLELFLRPFLKIRSHDRSAHTFGSSHRFLEVPQKGVLILIFLIFLSDPQKLNFKHLKYGMVVNWHK